MDMPAICPSCNDHKHIVGDRQGPPTEKEWEVRCEGCGWSDIYIKGDPEKVDKEEKEKSKSETMRELGQDLKENIDRLMESESTPDPESEMDFDLQFKVDIKEDLNWTMKTVSQHAGWLQFDEKSEVMEQVHHQVDQCQKTNTMIYFDDFEPVEDEPGTFRAYASRRGLVKNVYVEMRVKKEVLASKEDLDTLLE